MHICKCAGTLIVLVAVLCSTAAWGEPLPVVDLSIATPAELDEAAMFTFAIISDHKGFSPRDSVHMRRANRWMREMDPQAIIGMGDHLKRRWENTFLPFIAEDRLWRDRFWPNIADGENGYYGSSQSDWGAGRKLVDDAGLRERENVTIRDNGCEYYARIAAAGHTIHLIQLHYSDNPRDLEVAFNASSRQYLRDTLNSIEKGPTDIIVCGAHSRTGNWMPVLSEDLRALVLSKADLVLSATTHLFRRFDYGADKALCINTGSCGFRNKHGKNGFVSVHVLAGPPRLVVQYVATDDGDDRPLAPPEMAFVKTLGGSTTAVRFVMEAQ